jgi:hypothetical protein
VSAALSAPAPRTLAEMLRYIGEEARMGRLPEPHVLELCARTAHELELARQHVPAILPENVLPFRRRQA